MPIVFLVFLLVLAPANNLFAFETTMTCQKAMSKKAISLDLKEFIIEQIDIFEKQNPAFDVVSLREKIVNNESSNAYHDDPGLAFWLLLASCDQYQDSEEFLGKRLQKILGCFYNNIDNEKNMQKCIERV